MSRWLAAPESGWLSNVVIFSVMRRPRRPLLRLLGRLLLLLLALVVPVRASAEVVGSEHCRAHGAHGGAALSVHSAEHAGHQQAGASMDRTTPESSDECTHCPDALCAVMTTCSSAASASLARPAELPTASFIPPHQTLLGHPAAPGSITQEPPTRPPLLLL